LVFQCPSLTDAQALVEDTLGGQTAKIGWRGDGQCGSLIVNHPSIHGMDVRLCEVRESSNEWALSSSFDEAQESLLAGSLDELQSTLVMSDGKGSDDESTVEVDPKTNSADCWVEVRSNVKHPTGYRKQQER
jgi:3-hydroxyacyl-CoA dehydrogenase